MGGVVRSQGTETSLRAATKVNVRGASSQYIQQGLLRELELESPSPCRQAKAAIDGGSSWGNETIETPGVKAAARRERTEG